jgi:hypothetical protein
MDVLLSAFLESLMPEIAKTAATGAATEAIAAPMISEAVMGGGAAPLSMGQQMGNFATNAVTQQMQPAMSVYNTAMNPASTAGDIARSGFEYSIKSDADPQNKVTIPSMAPMNPYANMASNNVGGIPSLLQNTQSGLLPFFGAR